MHLPKWGWRTFSVLVIVLIGVFLGQTFAEAERGAIGKPDYSISQLKLAYKKGNPPRPAQLIGDWMLIAWLTEDGLIGDGKQHFNENGFTSRHEAASGLNWKIHVSSQTTGDLRISFDYFGPEPPTFSKSGELILEKDYAGDSLWRYQCRISTQSHLVCMLDGDAGHGIEFRKL